MARKGRNIYKRKDGRWEGRFLTEKEGKKQYCSVYGKSYGEAKEKLANAKMNSRTFVKMQETESKKFSCYLKEWEMYIEERVKESSYIKYHNVVWHYIIPYLGEIYLEEISAPVIEEYINKLYREGSSHNTPLSTKTVRDTVSILRSIFQFIEKKYGFHCCDTGILSVPHKKQEIRVFTHEEQSRLTGWLLKKKGRRDIGVLLALYTGIRIGELCALKAESINLGTKTLFIQYTVQRLQMIDKDTSKKTQLVRSMPKSCCSARQIPIPDFLVHILQPFLRIPDAYFLSGDVKKMVEPRNMQYYFKKIMKENGIENATFHTLRHTFATRCVEQKFDLKSLSEILGHATVNITLNKYVHPSMQLKRENMEKLSELFAVEKVVSISENGENTEKDQ